MPFNRHSPVHAALFYAIALGLAIAVAALSGLFGEGSPLVTMLTPAIAVAVMTIFIDRSGQGRFGWSALGVTTLGRGGFWLAVFGPVAILLLCDAVLLATGWASLQWPAVSAPPAQIAVRIVLGLAVGLVFAFSEEIGWRGYLLPRLAGFGLLPAMLLTGFLHGVWHLPLLLATPYYHADGNPWLVAPLFLVTLTLAGVFYGYLRVSTGSVWPVAIAHAVFNFVWGLGIEFIAGTSPGVMEYFGGESGLLVIAALLLFTVLLLPSIRRMEPSARLQV